MTARTKLTRASREYILDEQGSKCPLCLEVISRYSDFQIDHAHALGLGGSNDRDNLRAVHSACHKVKTKSDVGKIAKVARNAEKQRRHLEAMEAGGHPPNAKERALARMRERQAEPIAQRQE